MTALKERVERFERDRAYNYFKFLLEMEGVPHQQFIGSSGLLTELYWEDLGDLLLQLGDRVEQRGLAEFFLESVMRLERAVNGFPRGAYSVRGQSTKAQSLLLDKLVRLQKNLAQILPNIYIDEKETERLFKRLRVIRQAIRSSYG